MFDFIPQEYEKLINIIFLVVTALIARHGITYKKENGDRVGEIGDPGGTSSKKYQKMSL